MKLTLKNSLKLSVLCLSLTPLLSIQAADDKLDDKTQACINEKITHASGRTLIADIRTECQIEVTNTENQNLGAISRRIKDESTTKNNSYVLTPHRMNYILPVSFTDGINSDTYAADDSDFGWAENLEDQEAKYQISIKAPLSYGDLFTKNDGLYFAITIQSWWQIYSDNISKPFRETNYQPEVFYFSPLDWHPMGGNTGFTVGMEHQSNGRSTAISRSWNRVYASFLFEKDNFAFAIKPWYRLEEDEKEFEGDPEGDDNPDINKYMGYFQGNMVYEHETLEYSMMFRNNFATHKGAIELGLTFPLWGRLRGYVQAFSGYGESLIEYDHNQNRIGFGVALNNVL